MSNIRFYEDLYVVSEAVAKASDRIYTLKQMLREMNRNLPSAVYVPFTQGMLSELPKALIFLSFRKFEALRDTAHLRRRIKSV